MKNWLDNLGPGVLVSAAFIGPGTVTVCTIAGVEFKFALLWALLLSVIACIVLQEMAARLGVITGHGLSEVIRKEVKSPFFKTLSLILIFGAIVIGNGAYEAGNISGAVMGVAAIVPSLNVQIGELTLQLWSLVIGMVAFGILAIGNYRVLEKVFLGLVGVMSISFVLTAIIVQPDISELVEGLLVPSKGTAGILTIMALIGTTVVPYNLFLHASLVSEKWSGQEGLKIARKELFWAILLGGLVSMAIVVTAAASGIDKVQDAADFAKGLEPLFGNLATWFIALGLFAAGISSAITAPLAAAYVVQGCLGWKKGLNSRKFKMVWATVLLLGVIFSSLGFKPVVVIQFAQVANGILLPVVAIFLFWIINKATVMGTYTNTLKQNVVGIIIIAMTLFLGAKSIYTVIEGF